MERWFVRRAKAIFADNFSCAKIILLAKDGQAKIAVGNFFGAVFAPIFSRPLCGPKNAVNFLDHDGPKKGCNPWPSAERFSFVRCAAMSKLQKRYSLTKSNRNSAWSEKDIFIFNWLHIDNSWRGIAIAPRRSPTFWAKYFSLSCWNYIEIHRFKNHGLI